MVHSVWRKLISSWSVSTMYCYCRYCYLLRVVCNFSFFLFGLSAFWKQFFFSLGGYGREENAWWLLCSLGSKFFFSFHFGGSVIISLFCNFFYWLFGIVCVYLWWFYILFGIHIICQTADLLFKIEVIWKTISK